VAGDETEPSGSGADRIVQLERQLEQLREEVAILRVRLDRIAPGRDA
jgi:uncharacterized protein YceH (UPF0502 family)